MIYKPPRTWYPSNWEGAPEDDPQEKQIDAAIDECFGRLFDAGEPKCHFEDAAAALWEQGLEGVPDHVVESVMDSVNGLLEDERKATA